MINSAELNNPVHKHFHNGAILSYYQNKFLMWDFWLNINVVLLNTAKFPLKGTVLFCIPTGIDESLVHHSLANKVYSLVFEFLPDRWEIASQQSSDLQYSYFKWKWTTFHMLKDHYCIFLWTICLCLLPVFLQFFLGQGLWTWDPRRRAHIEKAGVTVALAWEKNTF